MFYTTAGQENEALMICLSIAGIHSAAGRFLIK
jgi:hypothetical protein